MNLFNRVNYENESHSHLTENLPISLCNSEVGFLYHYQPQMPRLLLVIPCHNEADRIVHGLERLAAEAPGLNVRVLLADNGSTDRMEEVVAGLQGRFPFPVEHHALSRRADKGLAIHRAWRSHAEGCDVLGYCDADMAAAPEALLRAMQLIVANQADMVVGDRWHPLSVIEGRSFLRAFLSCFLSILWRVLPRSGMNDPGCGLKVVRTAAFRAVAFPHDLGGFAFGARVGAKLRRNGYRVVAIPVRWQAGPRSRVGVLRAAAHYARAWVALLLTWR